MLSAIRRLVSESSQAARRIAHEMFLEASTVVTLGGTTPIDSGRVIRMMPQRHGNDR
jgi:hypothetical protein